MQSLTNRVDGIEPEGFDVVIVDEFHHAAAASYERLLSRLKPKILLGLTATPERADGQSVLDWFDGRIASESRLWDALDQGLLCPFHYFGVNDATDLSTVQFERGRYVPGELDNVFTGDHVRAFRIRQAVEEFVTDPHKMQALGFCAGVGHAHFMASQFTSFGYPAVALDASTPLVERRAALARLRRGELRVVFAVDLFNEGVDLPAVDTVLMLRPTESATVFLQQLGRGLRWAEGKRVLTVLDFVGQVRREYRYDVRYRALLGGTRHQAQRAVEADFPLLPPGCALKLDRIAKETVLRNMREAVYNARPRLADDLRALGPETRLGGFMRDAGVELEDIYARPGSGHCFTELRRRAGFVQSPGLPAVDDALFKAIGRLIHLDDPERIETWRDILQTDHSDRISGLEGRKHRLGLMLFAILGGRRQVIDETDQVLERIRASAELRREICDLLEIVADRIRTVSRPLDPAGDVPLASHATYTLGEIVAAHGHTDKRGALVFPQGGSPLEQGHADGSPVRYAGEVRQGLLTQRHATPTTRSRQPCFIGSHRTPRHPIRPPDAATSNNRPKARMSSCSCANEKGTAGGKPFRTNALAVPITEVTSRNDPCRFCGSWNVRCLDGCIKQGKWSRVEKLI